MWMLFARRQFQLFQLRLNVEGTSNTTDTFFPDNKKKSGCKEFPDSCKNFPDSCKNFPDSCKNFPDSRKNFPDSCKNFPDFLVVKSSLTIKN